MKYKTYIKTSQVVRLIILFEIIAMAVVGIGHLLAILWDKPFDVAAYPIFAGTMFVSILGSVYIVVPLVIHFVIGDDDVD